jgi:energy-coupling factor transport system ATP-binding protein
MNIIEIRDLNFSYTKNVPVIINVSLDIKKGEFVCILGHNGSGKSTLAKLIVGLLKAKSGDIFIDGVLLHEETVDDLRKKIGIVFQNPDNQFVGVTVKDDIAFGLENRQFERLHMLELIDIYSKKVGMERFLDHNPENLSGGEKQRVAIAGVLACNPEVIIFDESTSMLDPKGVREVNEVIANLKGTRTILAITHNLGEAIHADRVLVMNGGKVVLDGTPEEVFKHKDVLQKSRLDILESMKLIEKIEGNPKISNKKAVEELLWELTFKK